MLIGPRPSRSSHPRRCDFLPGKRKRRAAPARGGRAKSEKQIEIETISSRHAVCLLDFFVCREKRKKRANASIDSFLVGEGGFARLRTGRSAALMRRRRIIHSRSPSNPPDKKKKPSHLTVQRFSWWSRAELKRTLSLVILYCVNCGFYWNLDCIFIAGEAEHQPQIIVISIHRDQECVK